MRIESQLEIHVPLENSKSNLLTLIQEATETLEYFEVVIIVIYTTLNQRLIKKRGHATRKTSEFKRGRRMCMNASRHVIDLECRQNVADR